MHPLDVLMSRIKNLEVLPEKRTPHGEAQARLAVDVAAGFFRELAASAPARELLNAIERVIDIALDPGALKIHARYGIDPLSAIPVSSVRSREFLDKRWPRVLADVDRRRRDLARQYKGSA
jgi:hypothetical protein